MAATVGKIPPVLTGLAGRIDQSRGQLDTIVSAAQSVGCQVHPDGAVTYRPDHRAPRAAPRSCGGRKC